MWSKYNEHRQCTGAVPQIKTRGSPRSLFTRCRLHMHFRNFQKLCPIFSIKYIEKNSNAVSSWRNQHTQPGRRWVMPHVNIRQSAWIAIEYDIHETMPLTVHKMDIHLLCIRIHEYKSAAVTCQESGRKDSILACLTSP